MRNRLLDRQARLLEYLTSSEAIFGDHSSTSVHRTLRGLDRRLLHLEAGFSHEKRMAKIVAVFPRTFRILGNDRDAIVREFVDTCPPAEIGRLANARQFHGCLLARWQRQQPKPPYLRDLAACELACVEVPALTEESRREVSHAGRRPPRRWIRRRPGTVLLRCKYDIRSLFEQDVGAYAPPKRDTPMAIAVPPDTDGPKMFELLPVLFDLLAELDDWSDPAPFLEMPETKGVVADLVHHGLIEVRR